MKDKKKKIIVIIASILVVAGLIIYYFIHSYDSNLIEINYNELKEKIDNKEDFVLCVSRTTCIHCQDYKPKLKKVGYKYKLIFIILMLIYLMMMNLKCLRILLVLMVVHLLLYFLRMEKKRLPLLELKAM